MKPRSLVGTHRKCPPCVNVSLHTSIQYRSKPRRHNAHHSHRFNVTGSTKWVNADIMEARSQPVYSGCAVMIVKQQRLTLTKMSECCEGTLLLITVNIQGERCYLNSKLFYGAPGPSLNGWFRGQKIGSIGGSIFRQRLKICLVGASS